MPFDIYGRVLRSGHCEVHPHVHEEYPCTLCYLEQERHKMQQEKEPVELHPDDPLNEVKAIANALQYVGTHGAGHGLEGMKQWGQVVTWCRDAVGLLNDAVTVLNAHSVGYKTQEAIEQFLAKESK